MAKKVPRSREIPVTAQMFFEFRDDLKNMISSKFFEMSAEFKEFKVEVKQEIQAFRVEVNERMDKFDARMDKFDARMNKFDARMDKFDARQDRTDSILAEIKSDVHQIKLLKETEVQQNQIALDASRHALEEVIALRERVEKLEGF